MPHLSCLTLQRTPSLPAGPSDIYLLPPVVTFYRLEQQLVVTYGCLVLFIIPYSFSLGYWSLEDLLSAILGLDTQYQVWNPSLIGISCKWWMANALENNYYFVFLFYIMFNQQKYLFSTWTMLIMLHYSQSGIIRNCSSVIENVVFEISLTCK